ncbi:MAG: hypothetical protein N2V72_00700 [Methanophagales archaeon]|nr:hypothetical protein [Methanophagales archaeon]
MTGKIKGNSIELGMRCDSLAKDLVLADTETLLEIKDSLERLSHVVENALFELELLEDKIEQPCLEIVRASIARASIAK